MIKVIINIYLNIIFVLSFYGSCNSIPSSASLGETAYHEKQRQTLLSKIIIGMSIFLDHLILNNTSSFKQKLDEVLYYFRILVHPKI